jgi:hypothetical protein
VVVWDRHSEKIIQTRTLPFQTPLHTLGRKAQLYLNADGTRIALALTEQYESPDGRSKQRHELLIWDLTGNARPLSLPESGPVAGVAFHPDGERLAVAFTQGSVQIWRPWPKVKK